MPPVTLAMPSGLYQMGELQARVDELPRDRRIVAICRSGGRSRAVAGALVGAGFDAVNLDGRPAIGMGRVEEGYLRLTGRLKELINRGGEKISPLEVDEVLMDHPAVLQVVTFGFPSGRLGEDVGAAVVLRDGKHVTERELREFAEKHLAHYKVPRRIVFLNEIPKGATGKLQRIGLAARLGVGD